jgi:hypothetical protein
MPLVFTKPIHNQHTKAKYESSLCKWFNLLISGMHTSHLGRVTTVKSALAVIARASNPPKYLPTITALLEA